MADITLEVVFKDINDHIERGLAVVDKAFPGRAETSLAKKAWIERNLGEILFRRLWEAEKASGVDPVVEAQAQKEPFVFHTSEGEP